MQGQLSKVFSSNPLESTYWLGHRSCMSSLQSIVQNTLLLLCQLLPANNIYPFFRLELGCTPAVIRRADICRLQSLCHCSTGTLSLLSLQPSMYLRHLLQWLNALPLPLSPLQSQRSLQFLCTRAALCAVWSPFIAPIAPVSPRRRYSAKYANPSDAL